MIIYMFLTVFLAISQVTVASRYNITCYYDTNSINRGGFANFTESDLKTSLEFCTHIVYGYVGLRPDNFAIETMHPQQLQQFSQVRKIKNKYRHIKFLLSLGGGKDLQHREKYMKLLESNEYNQRNFISSVTQFLRKYNFDGFDLAYQFPQSKPKQHSGMKNILNKAKYKMMNNHVAEKFAGIKQFKKIGTSKQVHAHKQQFRALVSKLKNSLSHNRLMLTLTVLPHVNVSQYFDIPDVVRDVDFVNLGTFDYSTPERTPHEAYFLAPIQAPSSHNRHLSKLNIDSDVRQWLSHHVPSRQLNIGVATYGRAWKMTKELKSSVMPITKSLAGPSLGGELTHMPGLLSRPEICFRLNKMSKIKDKVYGNYAFRSANVKGHDGVFITYEDQNSLAAKAKFVERNSLGGVAIFDLTLDDFRDKCKEGQFPALKAIKFKLY